MKIFEIIETTADIGIRAFGTTWAELYANAALGMFSLITNLDSIQDKLEKSIEVQGDNREYLLVQWLNELIFLFDTQMMLFHRFEIITINEKHIKARCIGEKVEKSRHEIKVAIKSATYHKLKVEKAEKGYLAEVILDI